MAHNAARLAQTAKILGIPVIATTQINFGPISGMVSAKHHPGVKVFEGKKQFSMMTPEVDSYFRSLGRTSVVLYGCEAHICVKQTALDLLAWGVNVFVVVDAVTSMQIHDRNVGLQEVRDAGARLVTFQSLLFDLLRTTEHPKFKKFLPVVKLSPTVPLDMMVLPKL